MRYSERNFNLIKIFLNMKNRNLIFVMLLLLSGLVTIQSCKKETATLLIEHGGFTVPTLVAPANGVYVTLNGTTTVDLKWESTSLTSDAQSWCVYFGTSDDPALIETNYTSQTVTVDVVAGNKYNWRVVGTDAKGIVTTGETWSFNVVDPAAPLTLKMTWTTNALAAIGLDLDPTKAANMRLLIRNSNPGRTSVKTVNTAGFEEYSAWNTLADGKYYIATDISSTVDAGDFNSPIDIGIDLSFVQKGTQLDPPAYSKTLSYPAVMNNKFVCSSYRVYLGYVEKVGDTYTMTKEVTYPISVYSAVWNGIDIGDVDYPSEVETYQGCSLQIKGLVNGWMSEFWGEVIVKGGSASITIDPVAGTVNIPLQYYCTTKYNGAVQPAYNIVGSGTYSAAGGFMNMDIKYTLIQGSDDWGQWMFDNGYMAQNQFEAQITTDPDGKGTKSATLTHKALVNKPKR
jgi:hypothetical protein